jgi:hypothetical protein
MVHSVQRRRGEIPEKQMSASPLLSHVYVDPSASATADMQTLIAGSLASKNNNDLWGTLTIGP